MKFLKNGFGEIHVFQNSCVQLVYHCRSPQLLESGNKRSVKVAIAWHCGLEFLLGHVGVTLLASCTIGNPDFRDSWRGTWRLKQSGKRLHRLFLEKAVGGSGERETLSGAVTERHLRPHESRGTRADLGVGAAGTCREMRTPRSETLRGTDWRRMRQPH